MDQITHQVKTYIDIFQARVNGLKPWDFRKDDRGYEVGHFLHEREVQDTVRGGRITGESDYTGRELVSRIDYILKGPRFGLPKGYCIMTISTHMCKNK